MGGYLSNRFYSLNLYKFSPKISLWNFHSAIIYVPNTEILAPSSSNKSEGKKEASKSGKKKTNDKEGAGNPENPKNDTLNEVLDKAQEVLEKVAQSQEAGNASRESSESNRQRVFDDRNSLTIAKGLYNHCAETAKKPLLKEIPILIRKKTHFLVQMRPSQPRALRSTRWVRRFK